MIDKCVRVSELNSLPLCLGWVVLWEKAGPQFCVRKQNLYLVHLSPPKTLICYLLFSVSMNSRSLLLSPNPNSLKSRFTKGLLRALLRINQHHHQQPRSSREIRKRHRLIKTAAYGSMASAVGNRKVWSRALLSKIRNQARSGAVLRRSLGSSTRLLSMKKRICHLQKGNNKKNRVEVGGSGQVDKLRRLIPGCQVMDTCSLLEETAHYMKCLATQVKVMTRIVEIYNIP